MARYRRTRRTANRSFKKARTHHSKSSMLGGAMPLVYAAGYGAARGYASNLLMPITNKLGMLGQYADNVVMLGALWGLGKVMPSAKPIAKTGMLIEAAMIGGELVGNIGNGTSTSTNGISGY
jgi:hypothetical protein